MAKGKILVTSAAGGTQGKTGRHVAEMLLKRNVPRARLGGDPNHRFIWFFPPTSAMRKRSL
jgi:hypothetical protein